MFNAILGKKLEMTTRFDKNGRVLPATKISAGPCIIAKIKILDKDGYNAIQIGYLKDKKSHKPKAHQYKNLAYVPKHLKEIRIDDVDNINVGYEINVSSFEVGDLVNVTAISKGRGFAGVVKRWGFAGGPKTHGQSDRHRAPGSIGATTTPGRVLKGKKMAGRMGSDTVSVKNLKVLEVAPEKNLLLVQGSVPGHRSSLLTIKKIGKSKNFAGLYQKDQESENKKQNQEEKDKQAVNLQA